MKISALFPVVVAITLANFVSGFSLLDGGDYDLEVRDEFLVRIISLGTIIKY